MLSDHSSPYPYQHHFDYRAPIQSNPFNHPPYNHKQCPPKPSNPNRQRLDMNSMPTAIKNQKPKTINLNLIALPPSPSTTQLNFLFAHDPATSTDSSPKPPQEIALPSSPPQLIPKNDKDDPTEAFKPTSELHRTPYKSQHNTPNTNKRTDVKKIREELARGQFKKPPALNPVDESSTEENQDCLKTSAAEVISQISLDRRRVEKVTARPPQTPPQGLHSRYLHRTSTTQTEERTNPSPKFDGQALTGDEHGQRRKGKDYHVTIAEFEDQVMSMKLSRGYILLALLFVAMVAAVVAAGEVYFLCCSG